ncbi:hypothetical protein [Comamonas sp. B-9]|uniref:hypothetical protein n=1 Tax=Comamonas sp. B-9 TaxID=1055192 RepID=UPI0011DC77A1|nr:hypothetical protein [Comamonas sp. B-9]
MAAKHKVVIDANVARSSGETEHPVSKSCRDTLESIAKNNHSFVACKTLLGEWRKHQSKYSTKWLAAMFARRQIEIIEHKDESKNKIASSKAEEKFKDAALKDSHIIDAAQYMGNFVTSRDDLAKQAFASIPELTAATKNITWMNPVTEYDALTGVLNFGKKPGRQNKICL